MSIEIYKEVFMLEDVVIPRSALLPEIGIKKYERSYGSGTKAIDRYKNTKNKDYSPEIAIWLLAN